MTAPEESNHEAFASLYEAHYWAIVRFATRRVEGMEAARDVAAETFAVAWQRRDRIPEAQPLPWLYRVAGNLIRPFPATVTGTSSVRATGACGRTPATIGSGRRWWSSSASWSGALTCPAARPQRSKAKPL